MNNTWLVRSVPRLCALALTSRCIEVCVCQRVCAVCLWRNEARCSQFVCACLNFAGRASTLLSLSFPRSAKRAHCKAASRSGSSVRNQTQAAVHSVIQNGLDNCIRTRLMCTSQRLHSVDANPNLHLKRISESR
eukprot:334331-Rhodomonas_salina.1